MIRRRPTLRSVRANLAWLWRWKIAYYLAPPLCCYCGYRANVYFGRAWFCRQHPMLVPGHAVGTRPVLFPYTRKAAADLFRVEPPPPHRATFLSGQPSGRRHAIEVSTAAAAANEEEAALALADLRERGIALLDNEGKRVEPKPGGARFMTRFDEEGR